MSKTALLLDVSNLAHRASHAHGGLMYNDEHTGVLFGIRRDALFLEQEFGTNTLAFCFDSKHKDLRKAILPSYKCGREELKANEDMEAQELRQAMYRQVKQLYDLLGEMGCANRWGVKGYEGDDIIASLVLNSPAFDRLIIVSTDKDLWQLLDGERVVQFNPISKKITRASDLVAEYGIMPSQWASAKAWAGDAGDSVPGLKGVAEKTAAKWLLGQLPEKKKALFEANLEMYNRNIQLVKVPFAGCPRLTLVDQEHPMDWSIVAEKIGMDDSLPAGIRV